MLPPLGAQLDRSSPLTRGLIEVARPVPQGVRTYNRPGNAGLTGGTVQVGRVGLARSHTSNTDNTTVVVDGTRLPTTQCTVLVYFSRRSTILTGFYGFANSDALTFNQRISSHLPYSDGVVYWDFGGVSAGTTRVNTGVLSWPADTPMLFVMTSGPRGMEIWRDGQLLASNGASPTRTTSASTDSWRLGGPVDQADPHNDYHLAALWERQLSSAEVRELSANPWRLFRSARRTVPLAVAATAELTGTFAATEGADTAAIAGTVLVSGALAATEGVDTASLAGEVLVQGSLAATEQADTASFAGEVLVAGTLAATEGGDTASFQGDGQIVSTGALAATEGSDTASFAGSVLVHGSLSASETADAFQAVGLVLIEGGLSATEAADTASFGVQSARRVSTTGLTTRQQPVRPGMTASTRPRAVSSGRR